jgi:glutamate--cysteine ligase
VVRQYALCAARRCGDPAGPLRQFQRGPDEDAVPQRPRLSLRPYHADHFGIHYNFSLPDAFWDLRWERAGRPGRRQDFISAAYLGLIRNFWRRVWLPVYLFGAAPALCRSFLGPDQAGHGLQALDGDPRTLHMPGATSLRMGDLGYQSNAQGGLNICYNSLERYLQTLQTAILTPYAPYQDIGLGSDDNRRQLNTGLLQIETSSTAPIRPKRVAHPGEPPLHALARAGIEYIEVRCIDVNLLEPLGINAAQMRFFDAFLLACLVDDSPDCDPADYARQRSNLRATVLHGRDPDVHLETATGTRPLRDWAVELLDDIARCADVLDAAHGGQSYAASIAEQRTRVEDSNQTPAARIVNEMRTRGQSFAELAMDYSRQWAAAFRAQPLAAAAQAAFAEQAAASLAQQQALEAAEQLSFGEHIAHYYAQYRELGTARSRTRHCPEPRLRIFTC